jgi:hypothetical protein
MASDLTTKQAKARARGASRVLIPPGARDRIDPLLVEFFDHLNIRHFDGALALVDISKGIPADAEGHVDMNGLTRLQVHGRGASARAFLSIHLSEWLYDAPTEAIRLDLIVNTLLHEMVHLAVDLDALGGAHSFDTGHGSFFAAECNRIGRAAGWAEVYPDEECGGAYDEVRPYDAEWSCAEWPENAMDMARWDDPGGA